MAQLQHGALQGDGAQRPRPLGREVAQAGGGGDAERRQLGGRRRGDAPHVLDREGAQHLAERQASSSLLKQQLQC